MDFFLNELLLGDAKCIWKGKATLNSNFFGLLKRIHIRIVEKICSRSIKNNIYEITKIVINHYQTKAPLTC